MHHNSSSNSLRNSVSGRTTAQERDDSKNGPQPDSDEDDLFQQLSDDEDRLSSIGSTEDHDRPASAGMNSNNRSFNSDERIEGWNSDGDEQHLNRPSNSVAGQPQLVKRGSKIVVC